jgi:hypothetical protein
MRFFVSSVVFSLSVSLSNASGTGVLVGNLVVVLEICSRDEVVATPERHQYRIRRGSSLYGNKLRSRSFIVGSHVHSRERCWMLQSHSPQRCSRPVRAPPLGMANPEQSSWHSTKGQRQDSGTCNLVSGHFTRIKQSGVDCSLLYSLLNGNWCVTLVCFTRAFQLDQASH